MLDQAKPFCPECESTEDLTEALDRRDFFRAVGGSTVALMGLAAVPRALTAAETPAKPIEKAAKPAEGLIRELYGTLSAEQKNKLVLPWDHGTTNGKGTPTRHRTFNEAYGRNQIGDVYTKPQQELIERILRAICSGEEGYKKISRNGNFDSSGSLQGCGATIFGTPADGEKFAWVFTGHHLTVRCDGNSEEGAAFGGPMYYGHSPDGYSNNNVFYYQTKSVLSVFDALNEEQRKKAVVSGTPGEGLNSVQFRPKEQAKPGIGFADLTKDQLKVVESVMRDVLSPYRTEDADEVMDIIKARGGMEKIHLAFYQDMKMNDKKPWHFWRLEGPGFVWNYRVLPHVHTWVNISSKA